jgi:hypothetical protein
MVAVKTGLDKTEAQTLIYDFFKKFQNWLAQSKIPNVSDLEQYLSKNFQISSNGRLVSKSPADYINRFQNFQKKYARYEISKPLEEILIYGNKAVLYYKVDLITHQGQRKSVYIMAIIAIDDHKITNWTQVANEIGSSDLG